MKSLLRLVKKNCKTLRNTETNISTPLQILLHEYMAIFNEDILAHLKVFIKKNFHINSSIYNLL